MMTWVFWWVKIRACKMKICYIVIIYMIHRVHWLTFQVAANWEFPFLKVFGFSMGF